MTTDSALLLSLGSWADVGSGEAMMVSGETVRPSSAGADDTCGDISVVSISAVSSGDARASAASVRAAFSAAAAEISSARRLRSSPLEELLVGAHKLEKRGRHVLATRAALEDRLIDGMPKIALQSAHPVALDPVCDERRLGDGEVEDEAERLLDAAVQSDEVGEATVGVDVASWLSVQRRRDQILGVALLVAPGWHAHVDRLTHGAVPALLLWALHHRLERIVRLDLLAVLQRLLALNWRPRRAGSSRTGN